MVFVEHLDSEHVRARRPLSQINIETDAGFFQPRKIKHLNRTLLKADPISVLFRAGVKKKRTELEGPPDSSLNVIFPQTYRNDQRADY